MKTSSLPDVVAHARHPRPRRRRLRPLALALLVAVASAVALSYRAGAPGHTPGPVAVGVPLAQADASVPPPRPVPFEVAPTEAHADAKVVAVRVVEALTNYEDDVSMHTVARALLGDDPTVADPLAQAARPLAHPGRWSRGAVVYPQLGGVRSGRASVMVVVRQQVGRGANPELEQVRTLDVRLENRGGRWTFDHLASAGGDPVERPADLSPQAAAVVDDPRIELADSARWDIYSGRISVSLLQLMSRIAERTSYGVAVLDSGHPFHVFGTNKQSAHTRGHAVDIYRVGDARVIDDRAAGSPTYDLAHWLYSLPELAQLGAPWALDAPGGRSFTDAIHQDHLHVASR